jgi:hypothetical protein
VSHLFISVAIGGYFNLQQTDQKELSPRHFSRFLGREDTSPLKLPLLLL